MKKTVTIQFDVEGPEDTIDHDIKAFLAIANADKERVNDTLFTNFELVKPRAIYGCR